MSDGMKALLLVLAIACIFGACCLMAIWTVRLMAAALASALAVAA